MESFLKKVVLALAALLLLSAGQASAAFNVEDIRLEGLQRIAPGTVFTYLKLEIGDHVDEKRGTEIIHDLYATGFFKDIKLGHIGNVLVLRFIERPSISKIEFTGNEEVTDEQLNMVLEDLGLVEGRIYNPSLLDRIQQELERQYYSQGKYGVSITTKIVEDENNLIEISVEIEEGDVARIHQVKILGNSTYTDEDLFSGFELGEAPFFSFFSDKDQYSKQKLVADLETLRSYYLDRGFINFTIESTQVSVTPDKEGVYVTINVSEGEQFTVSDVKLAGELIVEEEELTKLLTIKEGEVFSRKLVTESSAAISERLGYEGYAFANVNAIPDVDKDNKLVSLTFHVDPGKRVYVRRINIAGNTKTQDEVIRREIRQIENGFLSTKKINRSRVRMQRLSYLKEVNVETPNVPGTADQVDVNFNVSEGPSGSLQAGVGYGTNGAIFNFSVAEQNFLGTGKTVKLAFDNSRATTTYNVTYTNPYYTLDGISRGINIFSRATDAEAANVSSYYTDELGANLNYGFPLSEFNTARLGIGFSNTKLGIDATKSPDSIIEWRKENGGKFDTYNLTYSWSHDARNRTLFATEGMLQRISIESTFPGSDIEYYKVEHKQTLYTPFISTSVLSFETNIGYGAGLGDTKELPFFKNYYLGGVSSVRGFEGNSLGPVETKVIDNGDGTFTTQTNRMGGNLKLSASLEWLFPSPFEEYKNSFRWSYFVDAGNVFDTVGNNDPVSVSEFRVSHGLGMQWMTPVGVLTFSYGWPLKSELGDETQRFQFTIGAPF